MAIFKGVNEALSFGLELALLVAFGLWGYRMAAGTWTSWVLAVALPLVLILLWGAILAPKAKWRLSVWPGALLSLGLFLLAAGALYQVNYPIAGALLACASIINRGLVLLWQQW
ncbi:MAG: YrdB family protein [Caldilineaceae bacterium]|nr:YrdB family protein [Caldilineaceae bacterium]